MSESETTAAKGEIVDPAKIKETVAAASNGSEKAKESSSPNGKVGANGDGASTTNGNGKAEEEPPVAGSSKSPSKKDVDLVTRAMGYLAAGKRDLLIRDPASAVASLAQACQLLGEKYGETAPECGEPYYYYGRALLDLARMEAGVIDNVLDGVPSEDDSADDSMVGDPEKCTDEEKEKVEKDVDEALQENYESLEKAKAEKEEKEKSENGQDKKEENGEKDANGTKEANGDKTDGNCATKNGKSSPAPKDKDTKASPKDKDAKDTKASPKDKDAAKASPSNKDDKDAKSSPAAKDSKSSPAAKDSKSSPAAKDSKASPAVKESKSSPAAKESKSSPAAKESKSSPAAKDAKSSPVSKESKSSPVSKESKKASPVSKESKKASPVSKESKSSPASKESKSSPKESKDVKAEDKPKYEAVTPEGDSKEEKMDVDDGKAKEDKAEAAKASNEKKESEEDSKDGDDEDEEGEEGEANGEDKENDEKEDEEMEEGEKDDSVQGDEAEKEDVAAAEKEDEEDPSNLQLAWEMLELAKNILVKQSETVKEEEKERKTAIDSRICDTFQTLGELSIENENYPQAIEDLGTCLSRRQKMLPEDSRLIAETHYQLGVAQGFNVEFDQAVGSLNSAISVLQKRIDNLKAKTESVDPSKKADAFYTREAEIKEIESLIPEIKEKITDTNDMKAETHKKLVEARLAGEEEIASKSDTSKVSTISTSLIKKRKKSESGDAEDSKNGDADQPSDKKPHIEEETKSTKEGETPSST